MRLRWGLLSLCIGLSHCQTATKAGDAAAAQSSAKAAAEAARVQNLLAIMPKCGLTCLATIIAASPCSVTDIPCSCNNATISAQVSECVQKSCSIRNQLTTKNTTETICQRPVRDETHLVSYTGIIGMGVATVAYLLRLSGKVSSPCTTGLRWTHTLWWDDLMITVAMILIIPVSGMSVVLAGLGLGRDIWTVPFHNLTMILKIYYYDEDLYLSSLPAVKISMLLTYLRIFQSARFKKLVYVVIALNVAYTLVFVLISVFQCTPLPLAWHQWDGEHEGHCRNINAQGWCSALFNLILDIMTLGLPLPLLWKMQLNKRKKFLVMLMFSVGFFVTVVSVIRLQVLIEFGNTKNFTWDYRAVGYWSTIEIHAAVVAACMPAIRTLIRRFAPKLMGFSSAESANPSGTGLSGKTAVSSGIGKTEAEVNVRPRESDEENFIPLQDMNGDDTRRHARNFSHPLHAAPTIQRAPSPAHVPWADTDDNIIPITHAFPKEQKTSKYSGYWRHSSGRF